MERSAVFKITSRVVLLVVSTSLFPTGAKANVVGREPLSEAVFTEAKTTANYASSVAEFASPEWKDFISKGQMPYHKVTLSDFKTISDPNAKFISYTHTFTFFSYHFKIQRGDFVFARVDSSYVKSGIDRQNSWKTGSFGTFPQMLQHEQGHLDINELYARKLALRLSQMSYVGEGKTDAEAIENLKLQMEALYKKCAEERDSADLQYDQETEHGTNMTKQNTWSRYLSAQLKVAGIVAIWVEPSDAVPIVQSS